MKQLVSLEKGTIILIILLACAIVFPLFSPSRYLMHIVILILIWSAMATIWSYMGRFWIIGLCHGAFMGLGAYTCFLLFNNFGVTPWLGMLAAVLVAAIIAGAFGYACFKFRVIGHYFAISTLVFGELAVLILIYFREFTGGRQGVYLNPLGIAPFSQQLFYLQFADKLPFYYIALVFLLVALYIWKRIDQSKAQRALTAIGDDDIAAASLGVNVVKNKTTVTIISAVLATIGGVIYGQYLCYFNPTTMVGISASLGIVFKAVMGGMFTFWGPTVGALLITSLEEYIRVSYGSTLMSISQIIYAVIIILVIILLPKGVYGSLEEMFRKKQRQKAITASSNDEPRR